MPNSQDFMPKDFISVIENAERHYGVIHLQADSMFEASSTGLHTVLTITKDELLTKASNGKVN